MGEIDYYSCLPNELVKGCSYSGMTPKEYWNEEIPDREDGRMVQRKEAFYWAYDNYCMMIGGNSLNPNMERSAFWLKDELFNRGFTMEEALTYTLLRCDKSLQAIKEYADFYEQAELHNLIF